LLLPVEQRCFNIYGVDRAVYMRDYMLRRYHRRRNAAIKFLGGKCACGETEGLQFDHKDRRKKSFTIAKLWGVSESRFWVEIAKCQLLCDDCHEKKTLADLGQVSAKTTHGTLSSYRYCKCAVCREAKAEYMRNYIRNR
jgi:5-methylcytosine-specific restriction endonuclease McrA